MRPVLFAALPFMLTEALIVAGLLVGALLIFLDFFLWRQLAPSRHPGGHLLQIFEHSSEAVFLARIEVGGRFIVTEMNTALSVLLPQAREGWLIGQAAVMAGGSERDFLQALHQALCRAEQEVRPVEYETTVRHQTDNRLLYCRIRLLPVNGTGAVTHVLGFIMDISSCRLAEQLLDERSRDFRMLVEQTPDTIARYDRQGRRIYANPAFLRQALTISPPGQVARVTEYNGEDYHRKVLEALESGRADEFECTWPAVDGEQTSLIRLVPDRAATGELYSMFSIGRDISALKATEVHLRESRALLRELNTRRDSEMQRVRREVAHEMHEDYGQRLSMLRLNLSMLSTRFGRSVPELAASINEALQLLDETILHMREIVSYIHPAVLNMNAAAALEWLAEDMLAPAGLRYDVQVETDALDETATSLVFRLVQYALSNVLRHAQASRVSILLAAHGDGLRLEVRDDGKGFDLDRQKKDSLGMVAMEELANMLHGEIVFLSAPTQGTVIEVCFPQQQRASEAV